MNAQQREAIRYCEDCKWCRPDGPDGKGIFPANPFRWAKCMHPKVFKKEASLVAKDYPLDNKAEFEDAPYCSSQRLDRAFWFESRCGKQGRLWEPK